jgi:hypothetical protein
MEFIFHEHTLSRLPQLLVTKPTRHIHEPDAALSGDGEEMMDLIAEFNTDPLPFARTLGIELRTEAGRRWYGRRELRRSRASSSR